MTFLQRAFSGDTVGRLVVLVAVVVSITATGYFYNQGMTLWFVDGLSRLMIAKQMIAGIYPAFSQSGTWWLPIPHVLMVPLVWNEFLYQSGLAGSVISMVSYIVAVATIYKLILLISKDRTSGVIGAAVFSVPSMIYMQSVPMSEVSFVTFFVLTVYFLLRWVINTEAWLWLVATSIPLTLAVFTRHEGWMVLLGSTTIAILYTVREKRFGLAKSIAVVSLALFWSITGMAIWLFYNWSIFGDPLDFYRGQFSGADWGSQVTVTWNANQSTKHNLMLSLLVYMRTVLDNVGWINAVFASGGLAVLALAKLPSSQKVAVSILLFPLVFYPIGMYQGGWVLVAHPDYIAGQILNLRFGIFAIPAFAVLAGFLIRGKSVWAKAPVALLITAGIFSMWGNTIPTVMEAKSNQTNPFAQGQTKVGQWLKDHWSGGLVLRQRVGNELTAFVSNIPVSRVVYEGDRAFWIDSLKDPTIHNIEWVFMKEGTISDHVWNNLHGNPSFLRNYNLVFTQEGAERVEIYQRRRGVTAQAKVSPPTNTTPNPSSIVGPKLTEIAREKPAKVELQETKIEAEISEANQKIPEKVEEQPRFYLVQPGDWLKKISRKIFDGDSSHWFSIWQENRRIIPDPNLVRPGQTLQIPN